MCDHCTMLPRHAVQSCLTVMTMHAGVGLLHLLQRPGLLPGQLRHLLLGLKFGPTRYFTSVANLCNMFAGVRILHLLQRPGLLPGRLRHLLLASNSGPSQIKQLLLICATCLQESGFCTYFSALACFLAGCVICCCI